MASAATWARQDPALRPWDATRGFPGEGPPLNPAARSWPRLCPGAQHWYPDRLRPASAPASTQPRPAADWTAPRRWARPAGGPQRPVLRASNNRYGHLGDHAGGGSNASGGGCPPSGGQRAGGQGTLPTSNLVRAARRQQRKLRKERKSNRRELLLRDQQRRSKRGQNSLGQEKRELLVWSWNMAGGMDTAQTKNSATRDELMALLKQHKPDVVMLQETWLSGEPDADWLDEAG